MSYFEFRFFRTFPIFISTWTSKSTMFPIRRALHMFVLISKTLSFVASLERSINISDVKCEVSEKFIVSNSSCFVEKLNEKLSTINLNLYFKKPMAKINVSVANNKNSKRHISSSKISPFADSVRDIFQNRNQLRSSNNFS